MALGLLDNIDQLSPKHIGVEEWGESSDYCNLPLYPRQVVYLKLIFLEEMTGKEEDVLTEWINGGRNGNEIVLSPNIRERRQFLRDHGYKHFRLIQSAMGRRASKGLSTGVAMSKIMWDTLQLGDPGGYYGIDKKKEIYFSCIAGSESQAKKFQYADMVARIEGNRAFEPYIAESLETEIRVMTPSDIGHISASKARGLTVKRDQARLRGNALAANAGTLRGSATMIVAIDEAAHMIPGESKSSAQEVYNAALPSLDQFSIDGCIFVGSSPYSKVGMFYALYEQNLIPFDPTRPVDLSTVEFGDEDISTSNINGDPRGFVFQGPSWSLFQGYRYYTSKYKKRPRGRTFGKMVTVSPDWDPESVDDEGRPEFSEEDKASILQARAEEAKDPETYKVERRGKFAEVSESWLNPVMVDRMFSGRPTGLGQLANGDVQMIYEPFPTNYGNDIATGAFRYKFHLDPSSTTAGFGFAIGHLEVLPDPSDPEFEVPQVVFDLVKRWRPQDFHGGVINWKHVLGEVMMYARIFHPYEITLDQHQSQDPIQRLSEMLKRESISCQVYMRPTTLELNWKKCEVFKTALYRGLVHAPFDEASDPYSSKEEMKFLQQVSTSGRFPRVDKQDLGPVQTKDRFDAVCDVTWALLGDLQIESMRQRLSQSTLVGGGAGGYGIGQGSPLMGNYPRGGAGPPGISEYYSNREERMARQGLTRSGIARGAIGQRHYARGNGRPSSRGRR